ncbi:hypothetical protein BGW42_002049 [Actinomortierella wolfii]|nr:hypothetical protein BGW42_002049 [Actinomortierella wolfii]
MSLAESVNGRSAVPSGSTSPLLDKFKQPQLRFLIFRPGEHDNLGQRLQGLISAVVMAMITQRAIIVDWSPLGSFEVPLDSLFQAPEGIDWFFNSTAFMAIRSSDLYSDRAYSWLPYCRDCILRSPLSASSPWSQLLCSPSLGLDNHHPVIEISSAQWFFPVLQHNVFWRGEMCAMFPGGGRDAFAQLAARLLRPSTQVQALVDGVLAQVPKDATFVGMQIEANPTTTPSALSSFAALVRDSKLQDTHIIEDAFLNCANQAIADEEGERMGVKEMEHNTSPDINNKGFSGNHSEQFSQREERQPIRYFLSTDSLKTREYLQHALPDRILVLNGTYDSLGLHTSEHSTTWRDILFGPRQLPDSSSHHTERQNSISYDPTLSPSTSASSPPYSLPSTLDAIRATQAMVAEIWILARAKRLIVTPSSSQGSVAHGLANLSPDLVTSDFECHHRQHSTQPCFQYWFAYALGGAACSIRATEEMSGDYNCWP